MTEDNPRFTNREGNEISQPNLTNSIHLIRGPKYLTPLLEVSLSTSPQSVQVSEGDEHLQTTIQGLHSSPRRQSMRHLGIKIRWPLVACLLSKGALWTRQNQQSLLQGECISSGRRIALQIPSYSVLSKTNCSVLHRHYKSESWLNWSQPNTTHWVIKKES